MCSSCSGQVLPSLAPRYAVTLWLLSSGELRSLPPEKRKEQRVMRLGVSDGAGEAVASAGCGAEPAPPAWTAAAPPPAEKGADARQGLDAHCAAVGEGAPS